MSTPATRDRPLYAARDTGRYITYANERYYLPPGAEVREITGAGARRVYIQYQGKTSTPGAVAGYDIRGALSYVGAAAEPAPGSYEVETARIRQTAREQNRERSYIEEERKPSPKPYRPTQDLRATSYALDVQRPQEYARLEDVEKYTGPTTYKVRDGNTITYFGPTQYEEYYNRGAREIQERVYTKQQRAAEREQQRQPAAWYGSPVGGSLSEYKPNYQDRIRRAQESGQVEKAVFLGAGYSAYRVGKGYVGGFIGFFNPATYIEFGKSLLNPTEYYGGLGESIKNDPALLFEIYGYGKGMQGAGNAFSAWSKSQAAKAETIGPEIKPDFKGNKKTVGTEYTTVNTDPILETADWGYRGVGGGNKGFTVSITEAPASRGLNLNPADWGKVASTGRRGGTPINYVPRQRMSKAQMRQQSRQQYYNPKFTDLGNTEITRLNTQEVNRLYPKLGAKGATVRKELAVPERRVNPVVGYEDGAYRLSKEAVIKPAVYLPTEIKFKGGFVSEKPRPPEKGLYQRPASQVKTNYGKIDLSLEVADPQSVKALFLVKTQKASLPLSVRQKRTPQPTPSGTVLLNRPTFNRPTPYVTTEVEAVPKVTKAPQQTTRPGFRPGIARRVEAGRKLSDLFAPREKPKYVAPPETEAPVINLPALYSEPIKGGGVQVFTTYDQKPAQAFTPKYETGFKSFSDSKPGQAGEFKTEQPQNVFTGNDLGADIKGVLGYDIRTTQGAESKLGLIQSQELKAEARAELNLNHGLGLESSQGLDFGLKPATANVIESIYKTDLREAQELRLDTALGPRTRPRDRLKETVRVPGDTFRPSEFIKTPPTKTPPRRTPPERPKPREPPKTPDVPTTFFPPVEEQRAAKYQTFVRRGGKFKLIGSFGTHVAATIAGSISVDTTPAAAFKVIGPERVKPGLIAGKLYTASKREAGLFIEPSRRRIDTAGERSGISQRGQLTLRARKIFR